MDTTCIKVKIMISIYGLGHNDTYTAGLYVFVECASCLQSLFQRNKTSVSFREIAHLIARNSFTCRSASLSTSARSEALVSVYADLLKPPLLAYLIRIKIS